MNELSEDHWHPSSTDLEPGLSQKELRQLRALLRMVRIGSDGDTIQLRTTRARIALTPDGTVRIEGRAIFQVADETIVLDAATIDLN